MNNKKLSALFSKSSFVAGVLVSTFVFLLVNLTPGITGVNSKAWLKNQDNRPSATPAYLSGEEKNLELAVKYMAGGDIIVLDEKGEVVARSNYEPVKEGPLTELRHLEFVTVTENGYDPEGKAQKLGFIDSIITPAMAAVTTYEYHYIKVDNQIIACRKHRKSPLPHAYVGKC